MSALRRISNAAGREIKLGPELGRGGEGTVYAVEGNPAIAAKIYHADKARERREKILAMVNANWHAQATNVAFPIDGLFSSSSDFIGFTMPRVGGHTPIHSLYSPTSRKTEFPDANFEFLALVALNVARALANVNATGCVVGDINHSGILISKDAKATLIDCDSFQVAENGKLFHCKVGVPEFTPPELQGKRLDQITRTSNHDSFGMAVLVFNLLFMGRHPFAGKYLGRDDMPMDKAIAQFRFAYSARVNETRMAPPPNVPLLSDIPKDLANALEMAFGPSGVSAGRPKLSDWVELLGRARGAIIKCKSNTAHQHFNVARSCPWCAMEKAYPGFLAFTTPLAGNISVPVNIGQLLTAINAVSDPGISQPLRALMPLFNGSPSPMPSMGAGNWKRRYFSGLVTALCSLELFYLSYPGPLVGALALGGGVWLSFKHWDSAEAFRNKAAQVLKTFESLETKWKPISDNRSFLEIKRDASECVRRFNNLGPEETSRLADLRAKLKDGQLNRFLERFYVEHATIKGIGSARKLTLRSYGVETAADVSSHRVSSIPGFGSAMTGAITAWRISIERKFVFDPTQPVNPTDVAAIRSEFAHKRVELHANLQSWFTKLSANSLHTKQLREQLRVAAIPVWNTLQQAELDLQAVISQLPSSLHKWGFGIVLFLGFLALSNLNSPHTNKNASPNIVSSSPVSVPQVTPRVTAVPNPKSSTSPSISPADESKDKAQAVATPRLGVSKSAMPPEQAPFKSPDPPHEPPLRAPQDITPAAPESAPPKWPESPPVVAFSQPQDITPAPNPVPAAEPKAPRNLANREDVAWVQSRLAELMYLKRAASGVWDGASRKALIDFKVVNKLPRTDTFDRATEDSLSSASALRIEDSFIGSWSETSPCDASSPAHMVINSNRAVSSGGGFCDFLNVSGEETGWRIKAKCSAAGKNWTYDLRFSVSQGQLIWNGKTGATPYFRCR